MNAIKEAVQGKYGQAALQARSGAPASCGCGTSGCCGRIPSRRISTMNRRPRRFPQRRCWRHSDAGTRRRSPS